MTRKTNENGEPILFGDCFSRYEDSVRYDLAQKLRVWYKECFYDNSIGIDYLNLLSNKDNNTKLLLENSIRMTAKTVNNLLSVQEVKISINETTRQLKVFMKVTTVFGLLDYQTELDRLY